MTTVVGPTGYQIRLVDLSDQANIQTALNEAIYGSSTIPPTSSGIGSSSVFGVLAPKEGPTFTGTVTLPNTTSIGNVTSTEISYLDNVSSNIQTQFDDISKTDNFWFGDGADGAFTLSSASTGYSSWAVRSGASAPYTFTLTRDVYFSTLTLQSGAILNPNGYRIFVSGTLTLSAAPSGAISFTPTPSTAYDTSAYYGKSSYGAAASDVSLPTSYLSDAWVSASGGGNTAVAKPTGGISWRRPAITFYAPFATGTINTGAGGSGGANSVFSTPSRVGGVGGVGGSGAFIYAKTISLGTANSNDGIISFNGTVGFAGQNGASGTDSAGAGGGGGGQGGLVYMVYKTITGSMGADKYLVHCSGASGGNGGTATGTGSSAGLGGQGGASGLMVFCNIKTGVITIPASYATLPALPTTSTGSAGTTYKATPA